LRSSDAAPEQRKLIVPLGIIEPWKTTYIFAAILLCAVTGSMVGAR
jgi:hypothetical protein